MGNTNSTVQVLLRARALIEQPEKWGQGFRIGRPGTYCAGEAITKAGENNHAACGRARKVFQKAIGYDIITTWNDHHCHKHTQALAAFDAAIALAKGEAS